MCFPYFEIPVDTCFSEFKINIKICMGWAGKMAKWLRALIALPEDPHSGSVLGTHIVVYSNP